MAGIYKTKQQLAIKKYLELKKDSYVTVSQIEKYLKENNYRVGLTTIYRHLEKMEQDGVVARLNVDGQSGACFQYVEDSEDKNCFYIKCEKCGEVAKMECNHLSELYSHVEDDHNFKINSKRTVFYGKCGNCVE